MSGELILPPPDIRAVADKTAEYVAKHGVSFEEKILSQQSQQQKFAFLQRWNPYRLYYDRKVREFRGEEVAELPSAPTALVEHQKHLLHQLKRREERKKQKLMLQDLDRHIEPPAPDVYTVIQPYAAGLDLEIMKICAQFVAANGPKFLETLVIQESRNSQFDFLKPSHKLYGYFSRLVESYRNVILPPPEELEKLRIIAGGGERFRDKVYKRFEYDYQQKRRAEDQARIEKEEREAMDTIDWHDFIVVEKILFDADDDIVDLPQPINPVTGRQHTAGVAPMTLEEQAKVLQGTGLIQPVGVSAAPGPIQSQTGAYREQVEMEMENNPDMEIDMTVLQEVNIRTDYVRRRHRNVCGIDGSDPQVTCPITGRLVRQSQFSDHLRVVLLDPQWKKQKDQMMDIAKKESAYADNIEENLVGFMLQRPDLFGGKEKRITCEEMENENDVSKRTRA